MRRLTLLLLLSLLIFTSCKDREAILLKERVHSQYSANPSGEKLSSGSKVQYIEIERNISKKYVEALEGLVGKIEGLLEMHIYTEGLASSTGDLCMDSSFESAEALAFYAKHPLHVAVADGLVRPFMAQRMAFDFTA